MSLNSFDVVMGELDNLPNVVETDLKGVVELTNDLSEAFAIARQDVYVKRAVIEVENNAGYPVGHIVFDTDTDLVRFIPHSDNQLKEF